MKIYERFIYRPHRWYDQLKDPKRFLVFFIPTMILVSTCLVLEAPGTLCLILFALGIPRMIYINKGKP